MTLPNFFVIGAQKGGTTSLYHYLDQHPEVFMSRVKEPGFFMFARDLPPDPVHPELVRTWADYEALFADLAGEKAVGEASTTYLTHPDAPANIHAAVPDARLVAVLRNPVDRAFSAYSMRTANGREDRTFTAAIDDDLAGRIRADGWRYVDTGRYGEQLTRYLAVFPAEQLQVHLYEDLARDTLRVVRQVFVFLGVDPDFVPDVTRSNVSQYATRSPGLDRALRSVPGRSMVRKLVPTATWERVRRSYQRRNSRPPEFPPELRARIVDVYRDDIATTAQLIGRDLSGWTATG